MSGYAKISGNTDWNTPTKYVYKINEFFSEIDLDPCSNEGSIVEATEKYLLPLQDGLELPWRQRTFVNPPYGSGIKKWFHKSWIEHNKGNEILMLVPVATNTSHWKEYVWNKATAICFLYDTRLKFRINGNENNKGCPMACCFIYYGQDKDRFTEVFSECGACVIL